MPSSSIFSGSPLFLIDAGPVQAGQLYVKFSQDPLAASSSGANDALNPNNYSLTGLAYVTVTSVTPVSGNPQRFILNTNVPLQNGDWRLTASNIETPATNPLVAPTFIDFEISDISSIPSISQGAVQQTSKNILRNYVPRAIKGNAVDALLDAFSVGDEYNNKLAQDAWNQLTIINSSGKYLDRNASNVGLLRPQNTGMADSLFREYVINVTSEKVTLQSFLKVLEIFYGEDSTRAHLSSTIVETYNIQDGDTLNLSIDNKNILVIFSPNDFEVYGAATAEEVAAVITRYCESNGSTAFAKSYLTTSGRIVRVYSGALGIRGRISCFGGSAQQKLKFPQTVATTQNATTAWTVQVAAPAVSPFLKGGRVRFTYSGVGTNPNLQNLQVGNYVTIYGSPANSLNKGSFRIEAVNWTSSSSQYFEIENVYGVNQSLVQVASNDLEFFAQHVYTVNNNVLKSFVSQTEPNVTDVYLSATTQSVNRVPGTGAYLHEDFLTMANKVAVVSMSRAANVLTVNTDGNHNLNNGDRVLVLASFGENVVQSGPVTVASGTSFTISNLGNNIILTNATGSIYPTFRDNDGKLYIKTTTVHDLTTGNLVKIDGTVADTANFSKYQEVLPVNGVGGMDLYGSIKLSNGKVLQVGGRIGISPSKDCYIFDPSTKVYSAAYSLADERDSLELFEINSNYVIEMGGIKSGVAKATTSIYNIENDRWTAGASMSIPRYKKFATKLQNGKIFVHSEEVTELYDPVLDTWTILEPLPYGYLGPNLVTLNNGNVFLAGGICTTGPNTGFRNDETFIYDFTYNKWINMSQISGVNKEIQGDAFSYLDNTMGADGTVVIVGGTLDSLDTEDTTVQYYDVAANKWNTEWSGLSFLSYGTAYCLNADGYVVAVGGPLTTDSYRLLDVKNKRIVECSDTFLSTAYNKVTLLDSGDLFLGDSTMAAATIYSGFKSQTLSGQLNQILPITTLSTTSLYVDTSSITESTGYSPILTSYLDSNDELVSAKLIKMQASEDTDAIGPYLFSPKEGSTLSNISAVINQQLNAGSSYQFVTFTSIPSSAPSSGFIIFNFGLNTETPPIEYLAKLGTTQLVLDSSYIFENTILSGQTAIFVKNEPYAPLTPTSGSAYLTDSISGRIAASNTIDNITAAGVIINKIIDYPSDIGLGNAGNGTIGAKVSDKVYVWGSQAEVEGAREE
jgi:hypothetical protein